MTGWLRRWRRRPGSWIPERLPPARRFWPTSPEVLQVRRSFVLQHPDTLELVLTFDDGGPSYAAVLDKRLARQLMPALEACMTAIEPLMIEDVPQTQRPPRRTESRT